MKIKMSLASMILFAFFGISALFMINKFQPGSVFTVGDYIKVNIFLIIVWGCGYADGIFHDD